MRVPVIVVATLALGGVARGESLVDGRARPHENDKPKAKPATPASAPRFHIGRPTGNAKIKEIAATFSIRPTNLLVRLSLEIHGRDAVARDISIPIRIPTNARANGLAIVGVAHGISLPRAQALEEYRYTVDHYQVDPALLELGSRTAAGDQLKLRAYPISMSSPMVVELTIELPRATGVWLDVGGQTIQQLDVTVGNEIQSWQHDEHHRLTGARAIALDEPPVETLPIRQSSDTDCPLCASAVIAPRRTIVTVDPNARHVDAKTSLIAGSQKPAGPEEPEAPEAPEPEPTVTIGTAHTTCDCGPDKSMIKKVVELHRRQLRRCYMLAAQGDPALAGEVVLKFAIEPSGKVATRPFEGTLANPKVRSCIANEVVTWQFPRTETTIEVNYPLRFQLRNAPVAAP